MSFQPFAVQCLTCGSQLRVTDPAIVGTIAACPKCNSMVQIDRPGGKVAVGHSGVDSQAITEEAIPPTSASDPASAGVSPARGFAGSGSIADSGTGSPAPTRPPQWQSSRTRRSRQVALVIAVSLSGFLAAISIFSWFVRAWSRKSASAQAQVTVPAAAEAESVIEASDNSTSPAAEAADLVDKGDGESRETAPLESKIESTLSGVAGSQTESPDRNLEPDSSSPLQPIPTELMPQSPIVTAAGAATGKSADNDVGRMQDLPPELAKYMKFLVDEGATDAPNLKAPPTMDEVEVTAAAVDSNDPIIAPTPKTLNLKADLAIDLALASSGYPLSDLILLVSQITGVPIQIDWVSFDLAGIDIEGRIQIQKGWHSARELLEETAAALGAELREEASLLILTLSDETFDEKLAGIADLQDFADSQDTASIVMKEFLRRDEDGAANDLQLGQTREEKQLAALAFESLRRMRGIAPKVADHRLRRWVRSSQDESVDWPLLSGGDAGPQRDAPITIAEFLRRTARQNKAAAVVNWYDANRRGAAPEQLVLPYAGADAAATLQQVFSRFALQVRQVDAGHWWVGSEATYDRLPVVVWTSPLGVSRDTFTRRLATIMDGASRDTFRLSIDDQSDRALLLLPRYIARQLPKIAPVIAAK